MYVTCYPEVSPSTLPSLLFLSGPLGPPPCFSPSLTQLSSSLTQLLRTYRRQRREIQEVRALYQKEALQRKLLYNEVRTIHNHIACIQAFPHSLPSPILSLALFLGCRKNGLANSASSIKLLLPLLAVSIKFQIIIS